MTTKFCFLFGKNLIHSPSSKLHNFWFAKYHFNIEYKNCVVQTVHDFVHRLHLLAEDSNFIGGNVTMPFKQTVLELCNDIVICSETVKNSASANTLFRDQNGFLCAANTDIEGIKTTLDVLRPEQKLFDMAVVYGGGGASASCIFTLFLYGWTKKIICLTREPDVSIKRFCTSNFLQKHLESGNLIVKKLLDNDSLCEEHARHHRKSKISTLIVNTMPLGQTSMYPAQNHWCISLLKASAPMHTFYFDLVYEHTDACETARQLNISYEDGTRMFQTQAAASFKFWTGIEI